MQWDVFCRVIDNFGDIGVCWRLAVDLGQRGHTVRLWVDDAQALRWMAPQVRWSMATHPVGHGQTGVSVHAWDEAERPAPGLCAGDVVIESFGCRPPEAFVALMQAPHRPQPSAWINLEYLSAEAYVERSHKLTSPQSSGAGRGLVKHFFYPGFTPRTGGLLREPGLLPRIDAFQAQPSQRPAWLAQHGHVAQEDETWVSVFCYANAPLPALLDRWAEALNGHHAPLRLLLTAGHASALAQAWLQARGTPVPEHLKLVFLPSLPQTEFDTLLAACDLNLVRGEDSAVRALWAGRPHIWQIYEQDDGVHADKLDAFMDRWMAHWPADLRAPVQAWWRAWNRLAPLPEHGTPCDALSAHAHPRPRSDQVTADTDWLTASQHSRQDLANQTDLLTQLIEFATSSG